MSLSVEVFDYQFVEVYVFDEIGRKKIDVIILGEVHYVMTDNKRGCRIQSVTTLGYVFAEIRIRELFVVRNSRLLNYFVVLHNFEPKFYHGEIIPYLTKKHKVLSALFKDKFYDVYSRFPFAAF